MSIRTGDLDRLLETLPVLKRQRYCEGVYFMMAPLFASDMSETFVFVENGQKVGILVHTGDLMIFHKSERHCDSQAIDRFLKESGWHEFWDDVTGIGVAEGEMDIESIKILAGELGLEFVLL